MSNSLRIWVRGAPSVSPTNPNCNVTIHLSKIQRKLEYAEGDCQGEHPLTVIRTGGVYAGRTKNFCKERRRLEEIFLPCGFSARKSRRDFRKNRAGGTRGVCNTHPRVTMNPQGEW